MFDLTASIRQAMADRGVKTRELMHHVPRRHVGTFYRILAGKTTDPWTSTVVDLCQAVQIDPDALLETTPPALDPEAAQLLEQAQALTEGDRWLLVDLIRTMRKRR